MILLALSEVHVSIRPAGPHIHHPGYTSLIHHAPRYGYGYSNREVKVVTGLSKLVNTTVS